MELHAEIAPDSPERVGPLSRAAEEMGYECLWVNETRHDPFVQLALAASNTSRARVGSAIALAFTRSPTSIAYSAWDIQRLSHGRLILGLGSQVKGHIERRFGVRWEPPVPRMKEVVGALREVWRSWQDGTQLAFDGRFFRLDLMTPFFSPGPIDHPRIPVYIAAVNPSMCRLAGAVSDGVHVHPLHTARYLREVVRPSLVKGAEAAGRRPSDVSVAASVFAAAGDDQESVASAREDLRKQIAFYASTRAYRRLMDLHSWGDAAERLRKLSVRGDWSQMPAEVTDAMVDEFVVEGTWKNLASALLKRYGGLVDAVRVYSPFDGGSGWKDLAAGFRALR